MAPRQVPGANLLNVCGVCLTVPLGILAAISLIETKALRMFALGLMAHCNASHIHHDQMEKPVSIGRSHVCNLFGEQLEKCSLLKDPSGVPVAFFSGYPQTLTWIQAALWFRSACNLLQSSCLPSHALQCMYAR